MTVIHGHTPSWPENVVQYRIGRWIDYSTTKSKFGNFLILTFIISALYGFIMKWSKLFPYLEKYYYDNLGIVGGMYHDGVSGVIVQTTLLLLLSAVLR